MSTMKELVAQYRETLELSNLDLDSVNPKSRHGWESRKNGAKEELKTLRATYEDALRTAAVFIVPVGPKAAQFASVAATETGAITVDADEMYNRIVDFVEPTMNAKRAFGLSQLFQMAQELRSIAIELGHKSLNGTPVMNEPIECPDRATTLQAVKNAATSIGGDSLRAQYVAKQVIARALEAEFASSVVPVLLTNVTTKEEAEALGQSLLMGRFVVADAPENTDTNLVLETLQTIKKNLKTAANKE